MTTERTGRTPVVTERTKRNQISNLIVLLEDSVASVKDLDGSDIWVYSTSWESYWGTQRTARDPI